MGASALSEEELQALTTLGCNSELPKELEPKAVFLCALCCGAGLGLFSSHLCSLLLERALKGSK